MDLYRNERNWEEDTELILLNVNKRVYVWILLFLKLMFIGLLIQNYITTKLEIFHIIYYVPFCIVFIWVIIYLVNRIKTKRLDLITYLIIILFLDSLTVFGVIIAYLVKDNQLYARGIYYELCFTLMFLSIKINNSSMKLKYLMTYKGLLITLIICLYDFKNNYEFFLIFDFYMIILCFGMALVIILMNKILWEKFQELYNSNAFISKNHNSMFNAMKTPLISVNYEKKEMHFNLSFLKFLKENYPDDLGIKFLLNEIQEDKLDKDYLNSLMNNISKEDLILLSKHSITSYKTRILIINKIFCEFFSEDEFNNKTIFNFLELLHSNKQFNENKYFELLGEFKLKSIQEKYIEISWRKGINQTEERLDIMINDITILKEVQFTKAEMKYKNMYLAKVAHEFKTSSSGHVGLLYFQYKFHLFKAGKI